MLPPPPTRFSTTSGWPKRSASFCATRRATVSELLPAVNGTMNRIGRSGQRASAVCAWATSAESRLVSNARTTRVMAGVPPRTPAYSPPAPFARLQSCNSLGFAQALDQGAAQQERARKLGVFRGPAQLIVVALADRGVLLRQQPLVADGLRLRVLQGDVPALALVAVEHLLPDFPPQDLGELLRQVERVMNAAVHPHGADRAVHVRAIAGQHRAPDSEFLRHPRVHDVT